MNVGLLTDRIEPVALSRALGRADASLLNPSKSGAVEQGQSMLGVTGQYRVVAERTAKAAQDGMALEERSFKLSDRFWSAFALGPAGPERKRLDNPHHQE